jgi:transcriptional regulator with XRE-family HTH domain
MREAQPTNAPTEGTATPLLFVDHWVRLGTIIRDARTTAGHTQAALAQKAGVSRAWLARVESGHRKAEIEFLMRTFAALDLTLAVGPAPTVDIDPELTQALRQAGLE